MKLSYIQRTGKKKIKYIKVYNKIQKLILLELAKHEPVNVKVSSYTKEYIVYEISAAYAANVIGFVTEYYNIKKSYDALNWLKNEY